MDKLLLTPVEAARALGISRSKVYELMRAGTLSSVHIDACRRIPAADLDVLIARLRQESGTTATPAPGATRRVS